MNALLVVSEYLSALAGHTVTNPEVLTNARILIVHIVCQPPAPCDLSCGGGMQLIRCCDSGLRRAAEAASSAASAAAEQAMSEPRE